MKYSKEQIEALKKYYPVSDYTSLEQYFPEKILFLKCHVEPDTCIIENGNTTM